MERLLARDRNSRKESGVMEIHQTDAEEVGHKVLRRGNESHGRT